MPNEEWMSVMLHVKVNIFLKTASFQNSCTILGSYHQCIRPLVVLHPYQQLVSLGLIFGYSDVCVVIAHWVLNLY